ncbi:MAG: FitA-like ribbon-helix-helix domain-containing protein [Longimicrobiales bacterium]
MKALTIRNLPPAVAEALEREKERRGASVNQTVIDLLRQGLGVGVARSNGLGALAGRWTDEELQRFEAGVAPFEEPDPELWV